MPYLKYLFHCGRQKRNNTSTIKMLHQMCVVAVVAVAVAVAVVVVVAALGLVLIYGAL